MFINFGSFSKSYRLIKEGKKAWNYLIKALQLFFSCQLFQALYLFPALRLSKNLESAASKLFFTSQFTVSFIIDDVEAKFQRGLVLGSTYLLRSLKPTSHHHKQKPGKSQFVFNCL